MPPPLTSHYLHQQQTPSPPRIITYYQTHHDPSGEPISVLPLLKQSGIRLTHLVLAAIHINSPPSHLTLNDHPPDHPRFATLWAELRILQAAGIRVLGMLGGAAKGSFARLDGSAADFEAHYAPVRDLVRERGLDGLDLDVEEPMSLPGVVRLIDRLRADFGRDFLITLAPVAAALLDPRNNLSGFDYAALEVLRGPDIAWYNAQFYCGWGDCGNPATYGMMVARGWDPRRLVVGLVTNPENGSGWVRWEVLASVLSVLMGRYPGFGGVMGWEYFNSLPGGRERPWEWARWMTALLGGGYAGSAESQWPALAGPGPSIRGAPPRERSVAADADADAVPGDDASLPREFDYHSEGLAD